MTSVQNIILAFSLQNIKEDLEKTLYLLDPEIGSTMETPSTNNISKSAVSENPDSGSETEMSHAQIRKHLDTHNRIVQEWNAPQWNKAFMDVVLPHILDYQKASPSKQHEWKVNNYNLYFKILFNLLSKKLGQDLASMYIDDLASFIMRNIDIYIDKVHGIPEHTTKDPLGIIRIDSSDPNYTTLLRQAKNPSSSEIKGKIVEYLGTYNYKIVLEGTDLDPTQVYTLSTERSKLELYKDITYPMKIKGSEGDKDKKEDKKEKYRNFYVSIENAGRDVKINLNILTRQIPEILQRGVTDFIQDEYPSLHYGDREQIHRKELEIQRMEDRAQNEMDPDKKEELYDKALELQEELNTLYTGQKETGPKTERKKDTDKPKIDDREEHPYQKMMVKYLDFFEHWPTDINVSMFNDMARNYSESDIDRLKNELKKAFEQTGMKYKTLPSKALATALVDAMYSVKDPGAARSGFNKKVMDRLQQMLNMQRSMLPADQRNTLNTTVNEMQISRLIADMRKIILTYPKFNTLKTNLERAYMKGLLRSSAGREAGTGPGQLRGPAGKALDELRGVLGLGEQIPGRDIVLARIEQRVKDVWKAPNPGVIDTLYKLLHTLAFKTSGPGIKSKNKDSEPCTCPEGVSGKKQYRDCCGLAEISVSEFKKYIGDPTLESFANFCDRSSNLSRAFEILKNLCAIFGSRVGFAYDLRKEFLVAVLGLSSRDLQYDFFKAYLSEFGNEDSSTNTTYRDMISKQLKKKLIDEETGGDNKNRIEDLQEHFKGLGKPEKKPDTEENAPDLSPIFHGKGPVEKKRRDRSTGGESSLSETDLALQNKDRDTYNALDNISFF